MHTITDHLVFTRGLSLSSSSAHSFGHWTRVEKLGHIIACQNGADKEVVTLFAYLHDARREDEGIDPDHGKRGVILLDELKAENLIDISPHQYKQLSTSLFWHNLDEAQSEDITIQTCWDADRLDLWRVGIRPDPKRMFTDYGRSENMINYSKQLYRGELNERQ